MEKKIYAAYGSNMDQEQMADRCPEAELFGTGVIKGYELSFRKSQTGYYASLDKAEEASTPVVLWSISEEDEYLLDGYEGCPSCYQKCELEVEVSAADIAKGKPQKVTALVYILPETRPLGAPRSGYADKLRKAYHRFGFDSKILDQALAKCKFKKKHQISFTLQTHRHFW